MIFTVYVKLYTRPSHKGPEGKYRYSSTLSLTSDVSVGQHHALDDLPLVKRSGVHFTGGWVGPSASLDGCRRSVSPLGFNPRTIQPVGSHYADRAIPAHIQYVVIFSFPLQLFHPCNRTRDFFQFIYSVCVSIQATCLFLV
jgi:hypothetical protein